MPIGGSDFFNRGKGATPTGMMFLQQQNGVGDIVRGEVFSVMPFHPLAQLECILETIVANDPFSCQLRLGVEVEIIGKQTLGDLRADLRHIVGGRHCNKRARFRLENKI